MTSANRPENMPTPPGDGLVASPSGGVATSPRASMVWMATFARIAALTVARSCAWLSVPFSRRPLAKKISDFCSGKRPKQRHRRLQRGQLAIGVEDVELAVVLAEGGSRQRIGHAVAILIVAEDQDLDDLPQQRAVVGEILPHPHGAALERDDRHQIRRRHLRVDELEGVRVGAHLIERRHRGRIEVQDQQPAVAVSRVARRRNGNSCCLRRRLDAGAARTARRRRGDCRAAGAAGAAVCACPGPAGSRWNSTKLIACGSPSSVMVKSFAVSPSIGLPSLSFTVTVSTISVSRCERSAGSVAVREPAARPPMTHECNHEGHEGHEENPYVFFVFSCLRGCICFLRISDADWSGSSASCSLDSAARTAGCRRSCSRRNR